MEVYAIRTQSKEEQVHVYESLNDVSSPQKGVTGLQAPSKVTKHRNNKCQKTLLVVICVAFGAAIVTLSVMMYSMKIAFERYMDNQPRNFEESIAEINATCTSVSDITKQKTDNQQQALEKLQDQQKRNDDKLRSFMETESSKNKVSLTACAKYNTYSRGESVLFPHIYINNGIRRQVITSLKDTGIFTCEKSGLYLISIFMTTNEHSGTIYLYKNSTIIAYLYYSLNGYFQTNSATVLEHLTIGDILTVKPSFAMYIGSDQQSCMSMVQLTN